MFVTTAGDVAVVKFQVVAFEMPAKAFARPSRIAPAPTLTCTAVLPGNVALGLTVIVNGETLVNATRVLSRVGIASTTRRAVEPPAAAVEPRSETLATFAELAAVPAVAFVRLTAKVFASAAVTTNAPLLSFCERPAINTTSPTTKP